MPWDWVLHQQTTGPAPLSHTQQCIEQQARLKGEGGTAQLIQGKRYQ